MKKGKKTQIKITPRDKLQALKRSRQYLNDYETYLMEVEQEGKSEGVIYAPLDRQLSNAGKKLCDKYDLFFPVNPFNEPTDEIDLKWVQPPITWLEPPTRWKKFKGYSSSEYKKNGETINDTAYDVTSSWDHITHINGKLAIMIDLNSFTVDELIDDLRAFLKYRKGKARNKLSAKRETKRGSISPNIWATFDKYTYENKTFKEITHDLFPIDVLHGDCEGPGGEMIDFDNLYKQVQRAYYKAQEIIEAIENPSSTVIDT